MFKVTATELPRLLTCNGSRLLSNLPTVNVEDTVKDEGNAADWLIQQVFTGQHLLEELVNRKSPNGVYVTEEMVDNLQEYLKWVVGKGGVEQDCSYQGQTWQVAGRADHVYYDGTTLFVSDFKYGWKIVDVIENWTLISHAVGWVLQNGIQPENVEFRIYQPRPYHPEGVVRSYRIDSVTLIERAEFIFNTLDNLNDELQTSKHCYRCPSMGICPAAQQAGMNAIDVAYRAFESEPTNDQVEFLMQETQKAVDVLKQNLNAYEDMTLNRLKSGQHFKNYQIQQDLGRETWRDDVTPEIVQMMTGVNVTKPAMVTPKQAIKAGVPEDFVKSLTTRPNKGVKLVRANANEQASKLFNKLGV